jgi:hypothetical protein
MRRLTKYPRVRMLLILPLPMLLLTLPAGCAMYRQREAPSPTRSAGVAVKQVVDKREPAYLIAIDGTECTVSAARFNRTELGQRVLCAWR